MDSRLAALKAPTDAARSRRRPAPASAALISARPGPAPRRTAAARVRHTCVKVTGADLPGCHREGAGRRARQSSARAQASVATRQAAVASSTWGTVDSPATTQAKRHRRPQRVLHQLRRQGPLQRDQRVAGGDRQRVRDQHRRGQHQRQPVLGCASRRRAAGWPQHAVTAPTANGAQADARRGPASSRRAEAARPDASSAGTWRISARSSPMRASPEPKREPVERHEEQPGRRSAEAVGDRDVEQELAPDLHPADRQPSQRVCEQAAGQHGLKPLRGPRWISEERASYRNRPRCGAPGANAAARATERAVAAR